MNETVRQAAPDRLRPLLSTALVASIGFPSMALATGADAEARSQLATVAIGGVITSTIPTLLLPPGRYRRIMRSSGLP